MLPFRRSTILFIVRENHPLTISSRALCALGRTTPHLSVAS
jgi:hypothetical protein